MNDDWTTMTEEEKYAEWSIYATRETNAAFGVGAKDYSAYCDWMDAWEAANV